MNPVAWKEEGGLPTLQGRQPQMLKVLLPRIKTAVCSRPVPKAMLVNGHIEKENIFLKTLSVPVWVWKLSWQGQMNTHTKKAYKFYWIFTCTWKPSQENEDLKKWPQKETFIPFRERKVHLWRIDKTMGFRVGVVNGKGITRKIKVNLALLKNTYTAFLALNSLSQVITMLLSTQHRMGAFHLGVLWPWISGESEEGKKEGQRDLFISAI